MINYKTLRFQNKKTEEGFNQFYLPNELRGAQYALLLGITTFLLFIPIDYCLFGERLIKHFFILRVTIASILAVGYHISHKWINTYHQLQIFALVLTFCCFASIFAYSFFDQMEVFYYFIGNTLLIIIVFNLSNIRFDYLRFVALFFAIVHFLTIKINFTVSNQTLAFQTFPLIAIALVSLASCWIIEYQKRQNFLNNQLIEQQKEALRVNNIEKDGLLLELKERNQELNVFNHSVSHDLKTPLRNINSFSKLLATNYGKVLEGDGQIYLDFILDSTVKMNDLINDLLAYAQVKQAELNKTELDMNRLVENVFEEQIKVLANKPILSKAALPSIKADEVLITQVWDNLISNALKYSSKQKEITLNIGANQATEGITYFIKDNGVGFDMKYAKRLFEPFSRLHNDRDFKGTGVGLSLVHRIMKKHNGKIWAESEPDKGATFYLFMPN